MQHIQPYLTTGQALASLDNGGRFYNLLAEAEDGKITPSELAKVGGLFHDKQKMILYLEMAVMKLSAAEKAKVIARLDGGLMECYHKYRAQKFLPSEAKEKGVISRNAIITGVPKIVGSGSDLKGFVLIPIFTGKVMVLIPVPLIDNYDVYELRDEVSSATFLIAHGKKEEKLPESKCIVAGVLKELKKEKDEDVGSGKFLEINYFISGELREES